jgi:rod shape-determining protein MreC
MPVVTHRGLVGRVVRVSYASSKVLLITDIRSAVDCVVQETRDSLVAIGQSSRELEVKYLNVDAKVTKDDRVISSGLGRVFPKGLLIGSLSNIGKVGDSLFLKAKLSPSVDLARIEEVLIIRKFPIEGIGEDDWR